MTVEEARRKAKEIRKYAAQEDYEAAHSIEDTMMRDTLKMVCNEEPDFLLVAKIAFEVASEARVRWYS